MLNKEMVSKINTIAQEDFERAQGILEGVNLVLGTRYGFLKNVLSSLMNHMRQLASNTKMLMIYGYI